MSVRNRVDSAVATVFEVLTGAGAILAVYLLWQALWTVNLIEAGVTAGLGIGAVIVPYCLAGVAHRSAERSRWGDEGGR